MVQYKDFDAVFNEIHAILRYNHESDLKLDANKRIYNGDSVRLCNINVKLNPFHQSQHRIHHRSQLSLYQCLNHISIHNISTHTNSNLTVNLINKSNRNFSDRPSGV